MKNLAHIIKTIAAPVPPVGFEERIFLASGGMLAGSMYLWKDAVLESSFWSLVALIFSDAGVVWAHTSEFALSLLETLPVVPLMAIFAGLAAFNLFLGLLGSFRAEHRQTGLFSLKVSM